MARYLCPTNRSHDHDHPQSAVNGVVNRHVWYAQPTQLLFDEGEHAARPGDVTVERGNYGRGNGGVMYLLLECILPDLDRESRDEVDIQPTPGRRSPSSSRE
jgi:hypothetical protein